MALWLVVMMAVEAQAQDVYELDQGQWRKQKVYDPESPEGQLQFVRKRLAEGKGDLAEEIVEQWIKDHPHSPLQAEARLLLGDAKVSQERFYKALFDYEYVIRAYPATEQFHTALEREFEIARLFVNGLRRLFLARRMLPAAGEGEELLIRIQERAPGSEIGERASLLLGDYYFDAGEMANAADAYDLFLINYPDTLNREWAMLRLIQSNLARFAGPGFDPTGLIDARTRLHQYVQAYPAAAERIDAMALDVRIEQSLAMKQLVTAHWYQIRGENISAAYLYRRLIEAHPATPAAEQAVQRLVALPVPVKAKTIAALADKNF